jgi:hypothetical protein
MSNDTNSSQPIQGQPQNLPSGLTEAMVIQLMHCLEQINEQSCSCEEAFALLDEYAELVVTDEEAMLLMPLVRNHMSICADCNDRFEALLLILQTEQQEN